MLLAVAFVLLISLDIQKVRNEKQLLQELNESLERAKQIAEDALHIAENANQSKSYFLSNMSHDIRTPMNARGHTFDIDVHHVIHDAIVVDKVRLNQICINLLSNAVKYTPNNGHIQFRISERSISGNTAHYEIVVSDNGYGMIPGLSLPRRAL